MVVALLMVVLSQSEPLPPPPPPPQVDAAPVDLGPAPAMPGEVPPLPAVRDENGVRLVAEHPSRVRVSLTAEAPNAELYDVAALMTLCRAPCGVWLNTDETRRYKVRAPGVTESAEFALNDFSGEVTVNFKHRNDVARGLGLASTIVGAVGIIGGAVIAVGWLIVIGLINLFVAAFGSSTGVVGGFEFLYVAALAAGVGSAFLTPGLILMLGLGRERLDIHEGPPQPLRTAPGQ
jgi:hypothetical protein